MHRISTAVIWIFIVENNKHGRCDMNFDVVQLYSVVARETWNVSMGYSCESEGGRWMRGEGVGGGGGGGGRGGKYGLREVSRAGDGGCK